MRGEDATHSISNLKDDHKLNMHSKTIFVASLLGLLIFLSGWFLHSGIYPASEQEESQVIQPFIDTIAEADSVRSTDFLNIVSGRFILKQSSCAGFDFLNDHTVLWTNESFCNSPDTLKLRWLSDSIFMTRSALQINKNCPPRVDIYKVIFFDGRLLILKNIWTGWNEARDEILEFYKEPE